jgi:UDP-glucose 4-epimerase
VVEALRAGGHVVAVVDDLSSGRPGNLDAAVPLHQVDVRDGAALEAVLALEKPEVVAHFAAQVDVRRSVRAPDEDADVNIVGSLRVLRAAARQGVRKVIYASSAAIFGEPRYLPVDDAHARVPISEYGISKGVVEDYLRVTAGRSAMDWTALRFANAYGPRQDGLGEAGVVAIFAARMRGGEPCTIFGDGAQTRDFVYAADCARAVVCSLEAGGREAFVVGTGVETSIRALHDEMARLCGHTPAPTAEPARAGEIQRMCFDAARAREVLGWRPATDLAAGLSLTLAAMSAAEADGGA